MQNAVTVCRGWDANHARVLDVQIVDFEAGGKMRVMSNPRPGQDLPANDVLYTPDVAPGWLSWMLGSVSSPPPSQLFSVTNGAPARDPFYGDTMAFAQKKWNALVSLGAEQGCHFLPNGASAKRYFGLSDPRGAGRQYAYIDTYDGACQSDKAEANREFSTYQGQPVNLFDATVGFHPLYGDATTAQRRTFIGTRDRDGGWTGTQDLAYLLTSDQKLTVGQARDVLTRDFRTMYNLQLDGGPSTQYRTRYGTGIDSDDGRPRQVPEVLALYDATTP